MKNACRLIMICLLALFVAAPLARAQGSSKQGPGVIRDPDLEKDSMHNLEVARHYFKVKKAYVAALQRCEEIIAGNPAFAKIDEVLFMAGESSVNLADSKGKQSPSTYFIYEGSTKRTLKPEEFRELARGYLSQLVNDYPDSRFKAAGLEDLKSLGGPKAKGSEQ
ncbi:MAG TPA: outer membrane protein assembly factor BamD [Pyrinomonadaceae bacterium]|nr:outer membrane protein assembly factor BamD [Pyrinomonadaceae bacterium]